MADQGMNLYLRKQDGEVYGPVDMATLQLWATDSRIAPQDEVSTDREHWTPAPDLAELHMDWNVELRDGTVFGPVHLLAVKELVQEGTASRRGKITNVRSGESGVVSEVLVAALIGLTGKMQSTIDHLNARLGDGSAAVAPVAAGDEFAAERERLEAEVRKLAEQKDRAQEEADKWKGLYEDQASNSVARENELQARFSTARATEARVDGLKVEVEDAKKLWADERAAAQKREADLKEQIRKLRADIQRAQELEQQVEKWKSLYEHAKSASGDKVRTSRVAAADANSDMVPRVRLEEVERKLAQVQKSYQQLLKTANRNLSPGHKGTQPAAENLRRWQVS